jgi:hypothetical protein
VLLAVLLGCSAALLLVMSSAHLSGWQATLGGAAAILLVVLGSIALVRPSLAAFGLTAIISLAVCVFWVTVSGHRASTTLVAVGAVVSGLAVVAAVLLAKRPTMAGSWSSSTTVFASLVPVGVVILTLVALVGSRVSNGSPAASSGASPANASGALALATTVTVPGENSKTFQSVIAGNDTEQSELAKWQPLDPVTQAVLTRQLADAYQAAMRYPTVADAKRAGMILAGGMAPGVGAHYQMINAEVLQGINPDGTVNPLYPASWIYASTADNAPVVGVMFEAFTENPPQGFAGPNDHWHQHSNVCVQYQGGEIRVPFAADQDVSPQQCADVHGTFMKKTIWMVHAWVVPGWESPQGVFSHDNLHVYCPGNTDLTDALGFCLRQS